MKRLLVIISLFFSVFAQAQFNEPIDSAALELRWIDTVKVTLNSYIPPVDILLDTALKHSPKLAFYNAIVKQREFEVGVAKKEWMHGIRLGGQAQAGNLGSEALNDINLGYIGAVWVQIPLSSIVGRPDEVGAAESLLESARYRADDIEREIIEDVLEEYNQLQLSQRLLVIKADARETAILLMEMAEKGFEDGDLSVSDLARTTDLKSKILTEYEVVRTDYENSYHRLERLVGLPFSRFDRY
ncbi:TolC family protein [Cryomorphaceae bacterium]|nr:TolC family protein [Cryomorphaceae bacterium]